MAGLVSRTLMVGALGAFITLVYVGVVVGVGAAIGQRQPSVWLSVAATALVAVAFQPVRERMQRLVNRLVYGARATPYEVLSDFAVRMTGRYTTSELLPRVTQTVSECLGGARVQMWLLGEDRLTQEAAWPAGTELDPVLVPEGADVGSLLEADCVVPVRHRDELLGALAVSVEGREGLTTAEETMLEHVASQAGLVLRNVRLVDDLEASRQRLVTSGDAQRRRIERDLHDGAQQNLVAVALMLRMAAAKKDVTVMSTALSEAADQLQRAIAELRELARGIHPAILTDRGLGPALASLADRCPVPVQLDNQVHRRLPGPIEATLYFVTAEALTNVAKYASASVVSVRLSETADGVALEIADDGRGGADRSRGTGLLGLADRAAVVGGDLAVTSPSGQGTTIRCTVPVRTPAAVEVPVADDPPGPRVPSTPGLVSGATR
jgi:signal transduction histidine kinase